ncbi:MAG: hypothetical protein MUP24_10370 [Gillisia sp.]|nr:hypothetical protein [Gillisia sp.]
MRVDNQIISFAPFIYRKALIKVNLGSSELKRFDGGAGMDKRNSKYHWIFSTS